jgi:hypothetical protein
MAQQTIETASMPRVWTLEKDDEDECEDKGKTAPAKPSATTVIVSVVSAQYPPYTCYIHAHPSPPCRIYESNVSSKDDRSNDTKCSVIVTQGARSGEQITC